MGAKDKILGIIYGAGTCRSGIDPILDNAYNIFLTTSKKRKTREPQPTQLPLDAADPLRYITCEGTLAEAIEKENRQSK